MTDGPSSALEEIRGFVAQRDELLARINAAEGGSAEYWDAVEEFNPAQDKLAAQAPRLVAALEAVLALADEWEATAATLVGSDRRDPGRRYGPRECAA
jgi:hypothetical protein